MPSVAQTVMGSLAATPRRLTEAASDLVFPSLPRRVAKVLFSVNAALRGSERRGWIEGRGRAVMVKQPAELGRFAGAEGVGQLTVALSAW